MKTFVLGEGASSFPVGTGIRKDEAPLIRQQLDNLLGNLISIFQIFHMEDKASRV